MSDLGELRLGLAVDMRELAREMKKAGEVIRKFSSQVNKVMASAGRAIARFVKNAALKLGRFAKKTLKYATVALLGLGTAAVKMAMNAEESENLFKESMGGMANAARKWSEEVSAALGMNAFEVRKNVATFNVMFDSMKLGEKASYDMAKGLTQLSYDMASFYNLKPEEAFQKLQSGITGEIEPLKRLGIIVDATTTKMWALKNGLIEAGQEMSQQQKVIARYGLIMEQTSKSQGDMERTLDSTTNIIRAVVSQVKVLGIAIGNELKPMVDEVAMSMRDWLIDHREDVVAYVRTMIANLKDFVAFMRKDWMAGIKVVLEGALIVFKAFGESIYLIMKAAFARVAKDAGGWMSDLVSKIPGADTVGSVAGAYVKAKRAEGSLYGVGGGGDFVGPPDPRNSLTGQLKGVGSQAAADVKKLYQGQGVFDTQASGEFASQLQAANEWLGEMPAAMEEVSGGLQNMAAQSGMVKEATFDIAAAYRSMSGQMGTMTQEAYDAEVVALDQLKEKYEQAGMDKVTIAKWHGEQIRQLDIELLKSSQSIVSGFKAAGLQLKNDLKTWGEVAFDVGMSISGSMSNAFDGIIEGTKSMTEAFQQFGRDITRAITRAVTNMIAQFIVMRAFMGFSGLGGMLGGLFGGGGGGGLETSASSYHRGGRVGTAQVEPMQPGLFRNAPRLHKGLEADEFPAVLQRGETVLKKGDDGGMNVTFHIENHTGGQIEAEQTDVEFDGENMVVGIVVKNYNEGGAIRDMVRSGG